MKPLPFSWSHFDEFTTCPRQFYGKRVLKKFTEPPSEHQKWGIFVHEAFEKRQSGNKAPLPEELKDHEPFMQTLDDLHGVGYPEQKIGISKKLQPCGFFDKDVWYRGAIDYKKVMPRMAYICDYKTGKVKPKWGQLKLNALHTFMAHPEVEAVKAEFYWTQTKEVSSQLFLRANIPVFWSEFTPALKQMLEAYHTDTWPAKQNGLCRQWCPDTECPFNGRK